jgi:hypothetical protein
MGELADIASGAGRAPLSVLGIPVKVDPLVISSLFGLVVARACRRWTAVGVEVERPQRSEDERP